MIDIKRVHISTLKAISLMIFDFEGLTLFTNIFWSVSLCSHNLIKPNRIPYSNKPKTKTYKHKPENYFKTIYRV